MQITPSALAAINKGFSRQFQSAFEKTPTFYGKLSTTITSTSEEEVHGFLDTLSGLREWVGERVIENIAARTYSLKNKDFEKTFSVDRNKIEDDKLGIYGPRVNLLGEQSAKWPDDLVRAAMQGGGSVLCHDGQYFFDVDHPVDMDDPNSATQANKFTSKALDATNYADVRAKMMAFKGRDGRPLGVTPNLLVVPPQLEGTARMILNAGMIASGGVSVSNVYQGSAELLVLPELANEATVWYLLDTSRSIKPFLFQQRKAPEFVQFTNPDDVNVFMRKEFLYGVDARGAAGHSLWFLASRCEG